MRTVTTFALALLLLSATNAFAQNPSNFLEGSWQIISQQEVYPDTIIVTDNLPPSVKTINSTHFAWGYQSADGEEAQAGGGRYTLHGDSVYVEHIEYHTSGPLVGIDIVFKCRVVGDTWYHTGEFPSGYRLEEVWHRVR